MRTPEDWGTGQPLATSPSRLTAGCAYHAHVAGRGADYTEEGVPGCRNTTRFWDDGVRIWLAVHHRFDATGRRVLCPANQIPDPAVNCCVHRPCPDDFFPIPLSSVFIAPGQRTQCEVPELVVERKSDGTMHLVRVSGDNSRGQSDTRPRGRHGEIGALGENPVRFDDFDRMLDRGPRQRRLTGRLGDEHLHRLEFGE